MTIRQIKRGVTSAVQAYTPAAGELVQDTLLNRVHIGDGVNPAGTLIGVPHSEAGAAFVQNTTTNSMRTSLSAAKSGANSDITSLTGLTTALSVAQGGTGATSATAARTALSAAKSGANSDITSITGLTTALALSQGGTGVTTLAELQALVGGGGGGGAIAAVYSSPLQTVNTGTTYTLAHGLGGVPVLLQAVAVSQSAGTGFPVGQQLVLNNGYTPHGSTPSKTGLIMRCDGTNVYVVTAPDFAFVYLSAGTTTFANNADWRFIFRAFR